MTDEFVKPTPLRHHLLFVGLIVGLVTIIGVFFTRAPMQCQIGYHLATTGQTQLCMRDDAPSEASK